MEKQANETVTEEICGGLYSLQRGKGENLTEYEEEVLKRGIVGGIIPVTVVREGKDAILGYPPEDYIPFGTFLREERLRWERQGERLLYYAIQIAGILMDAEEHFLSLYLFPVCRETVFVKRRTGEIQLLPVLGKYVTEREKSENNRHGVPDENETEFGAAREIITKDEHRDETKKPALPKVPGRVEELLAIQKGMAAFLREEGDSLSDPVWSRYSEHVFASITAKPVSLRGLMLLLERQQKELYRNRE